MMTVGVAQSRINEMNAITEELADCIKKMSYEENKDRIKSLEEEYGITSDLLHKAWQFLSITAKNFQEDLDKCEVDCQCW